jgi:hypothetical protein
MLDMSCVVKIIPQITTDILSTKRYKKSIPTSFSETIHSSCTNQTYSTDSTRNYVSLNNQAKNSYAPTYIEQEPHTNKSLQQTSDMQELKKCDEKPV